MLFSDALSCCFLLNQDNFLVSQADVRTLCKKTSWSERKVQVWFRRRRNQERPGLRKRFSEARCVGGPNTNVRTSVSKVYLKNIICVSVNSWRCVFYLFAFIYGIVALHDVSMLFPFALWHYLFLFHIISVSCPSLLVCHSSDLSSVSVCGSMRNFLSLFLPHLSVFQAFTHTLPARRADRHA